MHRELSDALLEVLLLLTRPGQLISAFESLDGPWGRIDSSKWRLQCFRPKGSPLVLNTLDKEVATRKADGWITGEEEKCTEKGKKKKRRDFYII